MSEILLFLVYSKYKCDLCFSNCRTVCGEQNTKYSIKYVILYNCEYKNDQGINL